MSESEWEWSRQDPLGNTVVLKTSTLNDHIIGDHTDADVKIRMYAVSEAPEVVENPSLIFKDSSTVGGDRNREKYMDLRYVAETESSMAIVVIVDTDRDPREVVSCTAQHKLPKNIPKEGVRYDRSKSRKR